MPRGKFNMGALSVDRLEVYLGRKRNRLRLAGFGTFLPGPKMEGFRLAQNPTRAPWYISTYDVMGPCSTKVNKDDVSVCLSVCLSVCPDQI